MNDGEIVRVIKRKTPRPPRRRAAHGAWIEPAWAVRRLVEKDGWTVSDAVRHVVAALKLDPPADAFRGVRVAYYIIKKKPWPKQP